MKLYTTLGLALCTLLLIASPAAAQNPVSFGAQLSLADDTDFGIGARALIGTENIVGSSRFVPSFDWFFPDDGPGADFSYWEINLNGHYVLAVAPEAPVDFYVGGGLNIARVSVDYDPDEAPFGLGDRNDFDDTDIGLNLLGGIDFGSGSSLGGFGELRIELGGGEQFVLTGGIVF